MYDGGYFGIDEVCMLMSATLSYSVQQVVSLYLGGGSNDTPTTPNGYVPELFSTYEREKCGMAIRCIKDNDTDPGSVTDNEGNVYPTVKIGNQVWMKQNLKTQHYNNNELIPHVSNNTAWGALTTGGCCSYSNDWDNSCVEEITTTTTTTTVAP